MAPEYGLKVVLEKKNPVYDVIVSENSHAALKKVLGNYHKDNICEIEIASNGRSCARLRSAKAATEAYALAVYGKKGKWKDGEFFVADQVVELQAPTFEMMDAIKKVKRRGDEIPLELRI